MNAIIILYSRLKRGIYHGTCSNTTCWNTYKRLISMCDGANMMMSLLLQVMGTELVQELQQSLIERNESVYRHV